MHSATRLALLVGLTLPAGLSAAPTDPATLFPADTPFYLELARFDGLARDLAALFKGTALEDSLHAIQKIREKTKDQPYLDTSTIGMLGALLGEAAELEALRRLIAQRSGGNEPRVENRRTALWIQSGVT